MSGTSAAFSAPLRFRTATLSVGGASGFAMGLGDRLGGAGRAPLRLHDPVSGGAERRSARSAGTPTASPYLDAFCVFGPMCEQDLYDI
jgi:hypothetical protein